jgi:hypothetical protein
MSLLPQSLKDMPKFKLALKLCIATILTGYLIVTTTVQATDRFSCGWQDTLGVAGLFVV